MPGKLGAGRDPPSIAGSAGSACIPCFDSVSGTASCALGSPACVLFPAGPRAMLPESKRIPDTCDSNRAPVRFVAGMLGKRSVRALKQACQVANLLMHVTRLSYEGCGRADRGAAPLACRGSHVLQDGHWRQLRRRSAPEPRLASTGIPVSAIGIPRTCTNGTTLQLAVAKGHAAQPLHMFKHGAWHSACTVVVWNENGNSSCPCCLLLPHPDPHCKPQPLCLQGGPLLRELRVPL